MELIVQKILEFHDLFPKEKELDVRTILKKYSREYIVRCCHVLCNNYSNAAFIPDNNNTFFSEASKKHIPSLNERISNYLNSTGQDRVCYCTVKTALELMRVAFSIPVQEYKNKGQKEDFEYDMFRSILMLNEHLMAYTHADNLDLASLLFANNYVQNDIINQNQSDTFVRQVTHYKKLVGFIENYPKCANAHELFLQKMGINSMDEYSKTWGALVTLSMDYLKSGVKACPVFDYNQLKDEHHLISKPVLDNLCIDITATIPYDAEDAESRDNNVDYRNFRSHPLVRVDDGKYLIYSLHLLLERLYSSLFFDIKDGVKNAFGFYNKEFVERRLFQPAVLAALSKYTSFYLPSKHDVEELNSPAEKDGQPDFYIREDYNIILFECKAIRIKGEIKDKSDISELLDLLKQKLYQSTHNTDKTRKEKKKPEDLGVKQLVNLMTRIDEDTFEFDDNIPDEVAYYPVLVLEDTHLVIPGISSIINSWYKELIHKELPNQMCHPVVVMSINTLIWHKQAFARFGFHTIFNNYYSKAAKYEEDGILWSFNPLADFDTFMNEHYRISKSERQKMFNESLSALGLKKETTSVN
ncbi:hypothetical protein C7Y71_003690 [Pseudoprevotella muciniphila]|uniref:Uncharacterized protein n=1 Tax=Pseudoprevotella muciniphila TaxID=2133944 RepID=A0A5P8E5B0_9BACT|nr:hypothetical protein [Pseudoprevotella muciniphila]QFQ12195.1 hypothetical protein C7Y71_003690 [Pseudoprevotella muciniphila]